MEKQDIAGYNLLDNQYLSSPRIFDMRFGKLKSVARATNTHFIFPEMLRRKVDAVICKISRSAAYKVNDVVCEHKAQ